MIVINALIIDDLPDELREHLIELKLKFKPTIDFIYKVVTSIPHAVSELLKEDNYDIILLDIVGVIEDDPRAISKLTEIHPYIPIIMLSKQGGSDVVIKYIDQGARSYIVKSSLQIGLKYAYESSRKQNDDNWERVILKIIKFTNDYSPIKRILNDSLEEGFIRKRDTQSSIIKSQVNLLKRLECYPEIATYFAKISNGPWSDQTHIEYEMPFYRMKSLRQVLFSENDDNVCLEIGSNVLSKVLFFAFEHLSLLQRGNEVPNNYTKYTHIEKYWDRLKKLEAIVQNLDNRSTPLIQAYKMIIEAEKLEINGKILYNPGYVISEIEKDKLLMGRLEPPFLCTIHGDLHFDNILVDNRLPKKPKIKLVDPRGFDFGSADLAYDIGKLLHSSSGKYDFIHMGYQKIDITSLCYSTNVQLRELENVEWINTPIKGGGSGASLTSHRRAIQPWMPIIFDKLSELIHQKVNEYAVVQNDPNIWMRSKFCEAMHFCTMGIFHIKENSERALAILVRGIELINQFHQDYKKGIYDETK